MRRARYRVVAVVAALVAVAVSPAGALAKVPICVRFVGPALVRPAEYQRLLEQEIRHHPTHELVREGCQAELIAEYLRLDGGGVLTGRLRGGVPHRLKVRRLADLPARIREVVSFLLRREPVYLVENLESSGLLKGPRPSLIKHGVNLYAVGVEEAWILTAHERRYATHALPAALFRFRRTLDRYYLGVLTSFAWNPLPLPRAGAGEAEAPHFVRFQLATRIELGLAALPHAWASPVFSALFGLSLLHVYGRDSVTGRPGDFVGALAELSLRGGVELLRFHRTRISCYGQVNLPLHPLKEADHGLIDAYTPSFSVGCEAAF